MSERLPVELRVILARELKEELWSLDYTIVELRVILARELKEELWSLDYMIKRLKEEIEAKNVQDR